MHGSSGDRQGGCRLVIVQATEITVLENHGLPRLDDGQLTQRGIDFDQRLELAVNNQLQIVDLQRRRTTAALERKSLARMIDQELTHDAHGRRHQMAAVARRSAGARQTQVTLMHECRGVEGKLTLAVK